MKYLIKATYKSNQLGFSDSTKLEIVDENNLKNYIEPQISDLILVEFYESNQITLDNLIKIATENPSQENLDNIRLFYDNKFIG